MKKELKDYLHLYLGCKIKAIAKWRNYSINSVYTLNTAILNDFEVNLRSGKIICKPILRPLSDMTEDEMIKLIQLTAPSNMKGKPTADDYYVEMFHNDDGTMVDEDVSVGCNFSCIYYEGQIAIRKCGSIHFFDENGEKENWYNMPQVYAYLLSKHFDLFSLLESGLAISSNKIEKVSRPLL